MNHWRTALAYLSLEVYATIGIIYGAPHVLGWLV